MRLDLEFPDELRRPRELEMPEAPVSDGIAEVPPPPPPDTLALRMERNEELSNVNSFPKIPRPPHARNQKPVEIADHLRIERRPRRDRDPRNVMSALEFVLDRNRSKPYPKLAASEFGGPRPG